MSDNNTSNFNNNNNENNKTEQKQEAEESPQSEFHELLISAAMKGSAQETTRLLSLASQSSQSTSALALALHPPIHNINGVDDKGNSALHWAAYFDEPKVMQLLLDSPHINTKLKSNRGNTCLHMAAIADATRAMQLLLKPNTTTQKALLDEANNWGETALHLAAAAGKTQAVTMLCEAGASTEMEDKWAQTALRVAYLNFEITARDTLQRYCSDQVIADAKKVDESRIQLGKTAEKRLLAKSDTDHNTRIHENKRLMSEFMQEIQAKVKQIQQNLSLEKLQVSHAFDVKGRVVSKQEAAKKKDAAAGTTKKYRLASKFEYGVSPKTKEQLSEWLVDDEVDNNGKDLFGWTALQKVVFWRKTEFIPLLLQHMDANAINCLNPEGSTVLHDALNVCLESKDSGLLSLLCGSHKVDKSAKNKQGLTVMQVAVNNKASKEIIQLLS